MITLKQLETELGEDNLLNALVQLELEAKDEYDDNDPQLAAIRATAANPVTDSAGTKQTTPKPGAKKAAAKPGGAIAKGKEQAQQVGSALTQAAKESKQANKTTNLKRGAQQAELDEQAYQVGYLHRAAQLKKGSAQVFGDQLTRFDAAIQDEVDEEVNIEDVLGGLEVAAPLGELGEQEDFTRVGIPVGITFFG